MNYFKNNFDEVISLGFNCYPKKFIKSYLKDQETDFFDYFGTPMWAITKLFLNNFEGFFDKEKFKKVFSVKADYQKTPILTHIDYHIRVAHDLKSMDNNDEVEAFFEKFTRRKERFYDKLSRGKNILFIRYEEPMDHRIIINKEYNHKTEYKYLTLFTKMIKNRYPNKQCYFIYFTFSNKTNFNKTRNILSVNIPKNIKYRESDTIFSDSIEQLKEF